MPQSQRLSTTAVTEDNVAFARLQHGAVEIEGRLQGSSNAALRVVCSDASGSMRAVYKPRRGERPLWDFPSGTLGHREVAAAVVDRALGWGLVPATLWREDGPLGPGSIQAWVDADDDRAPVEVVEVDQSPPGWLSVAEGEGRQGEHVCLIHENSLALQRLAVLDLVINNADRKGGHVVRDTSGQILGIDHGLTFHTEDKLRTVLWGWSGDRIDASTLEDLARCIRTFDALAEDLRPLLSRAEVASTKNRLVEALEAAVFPVPEHSWPALPWPAM